MKNYVYEYGDSLYINLTNRCSNQCSFCIRNESDGIGGSNLRLNLEPTAQEVLDDLSLYPLKQYREIVFCGFGEPMYKLSEISMIAPFLKRKNLKTRINTNGLGALINKRDDIPSLLAPYIDTMSISLNASNEQLYNSLCKPAFEGAYDALLAFAKGCVESKIYTILTVVDIVGEEEIEKCRKIAEEIGADFRVRDAI